MRRAGELVSLAWTGLLAGCGVGAAPVEVAPTAPGSRAPSEATLVRPAIHPHTVDAGATPDDEGDREGEGASGAVSICAIAPDTPGCAGKAACSAKATCGCTGKATCAGNPYCDGGAGAGPPSQKSSCSGRP